jgi:hypothetical protein
MPQADESSVVLEPAQPKLLILPKKSKFRGLTVQTPCIMPVLMPIIDHRGQSVGFYTKSQLNGSMNRSITPSIEPVIDVEIGMGSRRHNTDQDGSYRQYNDFC